MVRQDRPGAGAARNAGVQAARGELVAFLDSDCIPRPDWLEQIAGALRDAPATGGAGGRIVAAPSTNLLQRHADRSGYIMQEDGLRNLFLPYLLTANCCYRRTALDQLGGFDETLHSGEDTDVSWRMKLQLGLSVEFAPDAVVEHAHRTTLRGLWRQWVRYGWGGVELAERFPDRPIAHTDTGERAGVRRRRHLAHGLAALVQLPFGRSDPLDALAPLLRCVELMAMHVGRTQARRAMSTRR